MTHFDHNALFFALLVKVLFQRNILPGKYLDEFPAGWYLELLRQSLGSPRANLSVGSPKERPDQEFCQVGICESPGPRSKVSLIIEP